MTTPRLTRKLRTLADRKENALACACPVERCWCPNGFVGEDGACMDCYYYRHFDEFGTRFLHYQSDRLNVLV